MNQANRKKRETEIKPTSSSSSSSLSSSKPRQTKTMTIIPKNQAAFVSKLFKILELEEKHLINWSSLGERFLVFNPIEFSKLILPLHFKHNNWQSFVRQLNMYGFHKVNTSSSSGHTWEFRHPHFRRGRPDLITLIKRKSTRNSTSSTTIEKHKIPQISSTTSILSTSPIQTPPPPHQSPQLLSVPPAPQISSIPPPPPIPIALHQRRTMRYDPVRDPAAVTISSNHSNNHDEQISHVLRLMFGLISGMVKDPSMNDKLEATRLALIRLEESLHSDQRIDLTTDQFQKFSENQNPYQYIQYQHQDLNQDEEIEDEEMDEVEDEIEDEELEENEETEIESDLSRDSRSI